MRTIRDLGRRAREDVGMAAAQLALALPLAMVLLTVVVPIVRAGWEYHLLTRAVSHGVRYATRTDVNARESSVGLTRRPTTDEVVAFVREAAAPLDPAGMAVTVSPDPTTAMPDEPVTLTATYEVSFGPGVELANGLMRLFFGGNVLPQSGPVTVSAWGREE